MMPGADENRDSDLRARLTAVETSNIENRNRLDQLERWQRQSEISGAVTDEKWKNVDKRFDDLDKKVGSINSTLARIMWIILTGVIGGVVVFIVKGGLNVP